MKTTTGFVIDGTRYDYDFGPCNYKKGWAQLYTYQDAPYFGVWVNPERLCIFTYCEGDTTLQQCESEEEFKAEVLKAIEFYSDDEQDAMIDAMCNDNMVAAFAAMGLTDILH